MFRIKLVLEENDLLETISDPYGKLYGRTEAQKKKNFKAKNILAECIADSHLEVIKECSTEKNIVDKLTTTFEQKVITSLLRKKLLTFKYNEQEQLDSFFLKFDKLVRELRASDANPTDNEVICYLLLAMPSSFDNVVAAIETISNDKLSLEFVKNRLIEEEIKKKGFQAETNSGETSPAFLSKKKEQKKTALLLSATTVEKGDIRSTSADSRRRWEARSRGKEHTMRNQMQKKCVFNKQ